MLQQWLLLQTSNHSLTLSPSFPSLPPSLPLSLPLSLGVRNDAESGDGVDAGCRLLAGQLHHSMHHFRECHPHRLGHPPTRNVFYPWSSLQHSPHRCQQMFHSQGNILAC